MRLYLSTIECRPGRQCVIQRAGKTKTLIHRLRAEKVVEAPPSVGLAVTFSVQEVNLTARLRGRTKTVLTLRLNRGVSMVAIAVVIIIINQVARSETHTYEYS